MEIRNNVEDMNSTSSSYRRNKRDYRNKGEITAYKKSCEKTQSYDFTGPKTEIIKGSWERKHSLKRMMIYFTWGTRNVRDIKAQVKKLRADIGLKSLQQRVKAKDVRLD